MKPQFDCITCERDRCCNKLAHDLGNSERSLAYCVDQFDRGFFKPDLVERMKEQVKRLGDALKKCRRNAPL